MPKDNGTKSRYGYPFVECDNHPGRQKAYCICKHVLNEDPGVTWETEMATESSLGSIGCPKCLGQPQVDDLVLICESCALERGFLIRG